MLSRFDSPEPVQSGIQERPCVYATMGRSERVIELYTK
jgi:hypothetical protein